MLIRPIVVFFIVLVTSQTEPGVTELYELPSQDAGQDFEPGLVAKLDNFSPLPITIKRRVFVAIMEGKLQLGLGLG